MDPGLIELLCYSAWANRTLLDRCRPISPEQLRAAVPPTVAELLLHIAGAEENAATRSVASSPRPSVVMPYGRSIGQGLEVE